MKLWWIPMVLVLSRSSATPEGRPDRVEYRWFADGRLESARSFRDGKKVGRHYAYWPSGAPRLEATYADDAYDGEYQSWYEDGRPAERRHFVHGRESGLQQAWAPDRTLYLNYEVKGGRRYGLLNARPCVPIHEARS